MTLSIENKTSTDLTHVENLIKEFYPYAQQRLGFNKPVSADLVSDPKNAEDLLGKTAHYSPQTMQIVVYVDKRHPKDILRSFSHELVHHAQNCRGEFDRDMNYGEGYAQKDEHLRLMEKEAYLEGQMILRDWENTNNITKESKKMTEEQLREKVRETIEKVLSEGEVEEAKDKKKTVCEPHCFEDKDEKMEEKFPDLTGDGKVTQADILKGRGVIDEEEITEEEVNEEEVVEENEEVNEEETLQEWKNRTIYENLMKRWCK